MNTITITLRITDPETVEAYKDADPSYIIEDIQKGNLSEKCELVNVIFEKGDHRHSRI